MKRLLVIVNCIVLSMLLIFFNVTASAEEFYDDVEYEAQEQSERQKINAGISNIFGDDEENVNEEKNTESSKAAEKGSLFEDDDKSSGSTNSKVSKKNNSKSKSKSNSETSSSDNESKSSDSQKQSNPVIKIIIGFVGGVITGAVLFYIVVLVAGYGLYSRDEIGKIQRNVRKLEDSINSLKKLVKRKDLDV